MYFCFFFFDLVSLTKAVNKSLELSGGFISEYATENSGYSLQQPISRQEHSMEGRAIWALPQSMIDF